MYFSLFLTLLFKEPVLISLRAFKRLSLAFDFGGFYGEHFFSLDLESWATCSIAETTLAFVSVTVMLDYLPGLMRFFGRIIEGKSAALVFCDGLALSVLLAALFSSFLSENLAFKNELLTSSTDELSP